MRFKYCPRCGERLVEKEIGDEGRLPYCQSCKTPYWDTFITSVICAVINEFGEIVLLKQEYVSHSSYVCVAGIIKAGETAEEAAVREIKEEVGLDVLALEFVKSYYFEKKNMLMLGYIAGVKKTELVLSGEVDYAGWFPLKNAGERLKYGGPAWSLANEAARRICT